MSDDEFIRWAERLDVGGGQAFEPEPWQRSILTQSTVPGPRLGAGLAFIRSHRRSREDFTAAALAAELIADLAAGRDPAPGAYAIVTTNRDAGARLLNRAEVHLRAYCRLNDQEERADDLVAKLRSVTVIYH